MADLSVADSDALASDIREAALRIIEQADAYIRRNVVPADFETDIAALSDQLALFAIEAADIADFNAPPPEPEE